jgi:glutamine amidotransferase
MKIKIIDSKISNINSVKNIIKWIGYEAEIVDNLKDISSDDKIIFPGIGNFGKAIDILKKKDLFIQIQDIVLNKKIPFLGICLGMQLLMDGSEESGGVEGLSLISGSVKKFHFPNNDFKVPHIGWNNIHLKSSHHIFDNSIKDRSRYYFVHSYYADCKNNKNVLAKTNYGFDFDSIIFKDNLFGFQFHPEKSLKYGANLLKNFCEIKV